MKFSRMTGLNFIVAVAEAFWVALSPLRLMTKPRGYIGSDCLALDHEKNYLLY